ncbi:MAG: protein kinase domain-containing protein [Myxococcota bacterium]
MPRRLGKYELLERIALGGMAEVYHARQAGPAGFEKDLVVKCILPRYAQDEQFIEMFLDEARVAARLSHPNIVQIIELGREGDTYFMAMEYIRGVSLGDLMDRASLLGVRLPYHYVARIIANVCAGLDYAHHFTDADGASLGLVHRDVSPDNVLISYNGAVKMIDFGVAKAEINRTKTNSGVVKGKFCYMSPEQIMGEPLDGRSDLFSVGILLYEAAVGTRPFGEATGLSTVSSIVHEEPPRPGDRAPDMPLALEAVTLRALSKDRGERYPRGRHMQRDLEQFIQGHAQYVGDSDLGELVRRVVRGRDEDVRWVEALHAEVSTTPVGPTSRPISQASRTLSRTDLQATRRKVELTKPSIRHAGKLGGVGVASGHMPGVLTPAHKPGFRRKTALRTMARRRRVTVLASILVLTAAATAGLLWWLDGQAPRYPGAMDSRPPPVAREAGPEREASPPEPEPVEVVLPALGTRGEPPLERKPTGPAAEVPAVAGADAVEQGGGDPDAEGSAGASPSAAAAATAATGEEAEEEADTSDEDAEAEAGEEPAADAGPSPEGGETDAAAPGEEESERRVPGTIRGQGTLVVRSNLEGAEVLLDGRRRGRTPFREAIIEGTHTVEVRAGEASRSEEVRVGYGTEHVVRASFSLGRVRFAGVPSDVVCRLGAREPGRWERGHVFLAPGVHELICRLPSGEERVLEFRVRTGRTTTVSWEGE